MKKYFLLLLSGLLSLCNAETVYVAVASNFAKPASEIAAGFEKQTGNKVLLSDAGTGVLANQIKNNAPYQIFLSADDTTPKSLAKAGDAVASSEFTYAYGQLVLLSSTGVLDNTPQSLLTAMKYKRIAIANPKLAPYGSTAYKVLNYYKLLPAIESKIVTGENINATYQYVMSGNAELGFVALSQVILDKKIKRDSYWVIPSFISPLIKQNAVLLTKGQNSTGAKAFVEYLKSQPARQVIVKYGYK